MSNVAFVIDDSPAPLPFLALVEALAALSVSFSRKGDSLALQNGNVLTQELMTAVADHKPALLALCDLRTALDRLHGYIIRLRCEDPPKGTRAQAFAYQHTQIAKLAALSVDAGGTKDGWLDPADPFALGDQLALVRADMAELETGPYPAPLPEGCIILPTANFDPFAAGRLYNGKFC